MKNIKALVLDTTYVLPLFGIEVNISEFENEIKYLWKNGVKGHNVYLPSTCLLETIFKLLSAYRNNPGFGILERYYIILPTILNSPISIFSPEFDSKASLIALKIRHVGHTDFMDCLIAASAVVLDAVFLTEDKELSNMLQVIPETKSLIIWSWNDFQKNLKQ